MRRVQWSGQVMAVSESESSESEVSLWFIHRFECPDCGQTSKADRAVCCFRCGEQMEQQEKIAEIPIEDVDREEILDNALEKYGEAAQLDKAIEELGELVTALARLQNGVGMEDDVVDEIGDTRVVLDQLTRMFGKEEIAQKERDKLDRLRRRIESGKSRADAHE